jgi:folate-binding protein YgfZ
MNPAVIHDNVNAASDHPRAEFRALVSDCAVYDLHSKARIAVTGSDRVRWLNGMVTNNVRDLPVGHGVYAFLLNPQGKILGDLYAYNLGESLIVETDRTQSQRILETFARYIIMDDVEVADVTEKFAGIGVVGRKALTTLEAAGLRPAALQSLQVATVPWAGNDITMVRGDNPNVEIYEFWFSPQSAAEVSATLIQAGAIHASATALECLRIASGIPRYGVDIREKDLPQETGQERALNFSKGCYIGQEIVERIRSRGAVHRQFSGFMIDGPLPPAGVELQHEGKKAGEITSAAALPLNGGDARMVALGYIRREIAALNTPLDGGRFQAMPVRLPFSDFFQK